MNALNQARFYQLLGLVILVNASIFFLNHRQGVNTRSSEFLAKSRADTDTYKINLYANECKVKIESELRKTSYYEETINERKGIRTISINGIANHNVRQFPNQGNPNSIREHKARYSIPLYPKIAPQLTRAQGYDTGVLFSGVSMEPFTAEFFIGRTGSVNRNWNITTLTSSADLGLDCNNAHVQPTGRYHYHGTPSAFLEELNDQEDQMIKLGYAADGFPIYYKYGYDESGKLIEHVSGYQIKAGKRPGDGKTAPDGHYNGTYFQDYEFVASNSELDECNGRWGKTPESDNEYYYVITDNFPSIPICFSGTPSKDMQKHRAGPGGRNGRPPGPPPHRRG